MTIDEAAADIIATYQATPPEQTGPPLSNWLALVDGWKDRPIERAAGAWYAALAACDGAPTAVVKAHNVRARKLRAAAIAEFQAKFGVSAESIRCAAKVERVSSATGSPRPTWADAWRMARASIGDGPHSGAAIRRALEAVGMTNVRYHIDTEAFPPWVKVSVVKRGDTRVRRVFSFQGGSNV